MNVLTKIVAAALLTVAAVSVVYADPAPQTREHGVATSVCSRFNGYQPVEVVRAVPDGRGNSLVWLNDADGDLWLCNADNHGNIYANSMMVGDMLRGAGRTRLPALTSVNQQAERPEPQITAERICSFTASTPRQPARVLSTAPDGKNHYVVFVRDAAGRDYLCNASGRAEIFTFVRIGEPLNLGPSV